MTKFVADSSIDIKKIEGVDFTSVPLSISTSERTFTDDELLDLHGMLDYLEGYNGRSFTACPGTQAWLNAFEGGDKIYVVCVTSGLSGSYNSARIAAEMYAEDNPEARIHVFDSLSAGAETRILMEKIVELDGLGYSFEEVIEKAEEYHKKTNIFFAFQSIHNLAQNGRISKVVAAAVGALNIRIVGSRTVDGHLEPIAKRRGDKHAASEILHQLEECGYTGGKIRISHTDNKLLAQKYAANIKMYYPEASIKIYESGGLVGYYAERGGIIVACETDKIQFENAVSEENKEELGEE